MMEFLSANGGTIFVGAIVTAVIVAIVAKIKKDKKEGKSCSCGCGCDGCPSAGMCHK
ncbi:MAG: FeoB-associated Cys-rich membrane protein [Acutalibacteraceae bacterium]|nr:FeoB-associated Cys-rich membrane protein [Acutalibacteraceae bacterium]